MVSLLPFYLLVLLCLIVAYLSSLVVYRLFFSPIAKFPGPKLAAATFWCEGYYDVLEGGQYVWKVKELHRQYGPIVRINLRELHVDDPEFHEKICTREGKWHKWDYYVDQFGNRLAEIFTIPHDLHRLRRASVNPYFSKAKVNALEPVLRRFVDKLCGKLETSEGRTRSSLFDLPMSA